MTPLHLFLTICGAVAVSSQIMEVIELLDTPRGKRKHPRP